MGCCPIFGSSPSSNKSDGDLFRDIELELTNPDNAILLSAANVTSTVQLNVGSKYNDGSLPRPSGGDEGEVAGGVEGSQNNTLCLNVGGSGFAMCPVLIEQDSCYFEVHVISCPPDATTTIKVGLSTQIPITSIHKLHQEYCYTHEEVKSGDVLGVAVNFDDIPMMRHYENGGPVPVFDFSKVRGELYPVLGVNAKKGCPPVMGDEGASGEIVVRFVFDEKEFKKRPKLVKFGGLMKTRGLI